MPNITATTRLFLRTRATTDPDGWKHWVFPEVPVSGRGNASPATREQRVAARIWEVVETQSGVRHSTLKRRDKWGNQHSRALRRVEEDHLMKFAIRD